MNTINKYTGRGLWLASILLTSQLAGCFLDSSSDGPTGAIPTVISTIPADPAVAVPINQKITATFSVAMNAATIDTLSFTVQGASETAMVGAVNLDAPTNTASFTPNTDLTASKEYTATITTAATSSAGKALASDYSWTFTTGLAPDVTAPTIVSTSPADTDTGVLLNQNITATFDEALDPSTVNSTSFTLTADAGATVITGAVSFLDLVATFNPDSNLLPSTEYAATLTADITDSVVPPNALAADFGWIFTTGVAAATGPPAIDLGTAANFAVTSEAGVTAAGVDAIITGNIATSPITGASITIPCAQVTGEIFTDNAAPGGTCVSLDKLAAAIAIADVRSAYTAASAPDTPAGVGVEFLELGAGTVTARTLIPGVYTWAGDVSITGELTLEGSATDVWVFQIGGTLNTDQIVTLAGALPQNVFWQVASTVNLGSGAQFKGIVLAKTNVAMVANATITGRLLAQTDVSLGATSTVIQP